MKRWAPDYEREFLWDHSHALRGERGRRRNRDCRRAKEDDESEGREEQLKARLIREWESFNATQRRKTQKRPSLRPSFSTGKYVQSTPRMTSKSVRPKRDNARSASAESICSALDPEEVTRRRRNSRTLSREGSPTSLPTTKSRPHRRAGSTDDEGFPSSERHRLSKISSH